MIKFEKVSFEQFKKDSLEIQPELSEEIIQTAYNAIKIPKRSTVGSAGYDFVSPYNFTIREKAVIVPTGMRIKLPEDKVLLIVPRSGIGFKTGVSLANTIGVIDSDYYNSNNEGHIMIKLIPGFKPLKMNRGAKIVQGIILQYFKTDDEDDIKQTRNGGFGSTDINKS